MAGYKHSSAACSSRKCPRARSARRDRGLPMTASPGMPGAPSAVNRRPDPPRKSFEGEELLRGGGVGGVDIDGQQRFDRTDHCFLFPCSAGVAAPGDTFGVDTP